MFIITKRIQDAYHLPSGFLGLFCLFNSSVKGDRIPKRNTITVKIIAPRMKPRMNSINTNELKMSLPNPSIINVPSIKNIIGRKIGIRKIKNDP